MPDADPAALAGTIAYEIKDPDDRLAPGDTFAGYLSGRYDRNGDVFSSGISVFSRNSRLEGLAFFKYADGDKRKDCDDQTIIGSHLAQHRGRGGSGKPPVKILTEDAKTQIHFPDAWLAENPLTETDWRVFLEANRLFQTPLSLLRIALIMFILRVLL